MLPPAVEPLRSAGSLQRYQQQIWQLHEQPKHLMTTHKHIEQELASVRPLVVDLSDIDDMDVESGAQGATGCSGGCGGAGSSISGAIRIATSDGEGALASLLDL
jgi:hypothetical protein